MKNITDAHMKGFRQQLYETEKSGNTIEKYLRDVRLFRTWVDGRPLEKGTVLAFKAALCTRYAPKSVNSMLSSLHAFFSFLGREDLKVRALKIQRQIFAQRERELTRAEYGRLLDAAGGKGNERLYFLMQTIASTGVRISELKYVTAEAVRAGQAAICCKNKERVVFLPKALRRMLTGYMKAQHIKNGPVFISKNGRPLDRSNIWKMLKRLCKAAHVPESKVFPHNFRHLFARVFYSRQKDIVRLADILGHASINTTRIYTMETGEQHRRAIEKLGLLRC